jgi:CheY-like chemotaxis protein
VLVVEDDDDSREMLCTVLEQAGYTAISANDGLQAFRRMDERRPDLILLDIQMPVMDGWEFRTLQRRDHRYSNIPVIALTAVFDPLDVALKLGIRCLPKPLDLDEVLKEVAGACGA